MNTFILFYSKIYIYNSNNTDLAIGNPVHLEVHYVPVSNKHIKNDAFDSSLKVPQLVSLPSAVPQIPFYPKRNQAWKVERLFQHSAVYHTHARLQMSLIKRSFSTRQRLITISIKNFGEQNKTKIIIACSWSVLKWTAEKLNFFHRWTGTTGALLIIIDVMYKSIKF